MNLYYVTTNGYRAVLVASSEDDAKNAVGNKRILQDKDEKVYTYAKLIGTAAPDIHGTIMFDDAYPF